MDFSVRYKKEGWTPPYLFARFANGATYEIPFYSSDYGYAFDHYTKPYCYSCPFKGASHPADVTVGDYWGLSEGMEGYNPDGVSIFIVRTSRGESLVQRIDREEFLLQPANVEFALAHNRMFAACKKRPSDWERFGRYLASQGLRLAVIRSRDGRQAYLEEKFPCLTVMKRYVPVSLKRVIKSIWHRIRHRNVKE